MNITEILKTEIRLYFLMETGRQIVRDCGKIIYNFIIKYNPTADETQEFVVKLYAELSYEENKQ